MKIKLTKSQQIVADQHAFRPHNMKRRDFMGLGLQSFLGTMMLPSFISSLSFAQSAPQLPAFLVFDLVGGAALPGNFLVGGAKGPNDLLTGYDQIGFNPRTATMDDRFGLPAPADISQVFEGMIATMSSGAQSRFRMSSICHPSVDDNDNNTHSALGLVAKYWQLMGQLKQPGLGSRGTNSGGRTRLSLDEPALRPEQLTLASQLNLLTGLGLISAQGLSDDAIANMLVSQKNIYREQFRSLSSDQQVAMNETFEKNMDIYSSSNKGTQLDPRLIDSTRSIFNINQNSSDSDEQVLIAGIAHTAIKGFSGPSCIAMGGFDYHDGTQERGDREDRKAGEVIGRTLELAHQMNRPLFIQVVTDGSCRARDGRRWAADSGDRAITMMGYYHPDGVKQEKLQLGHFNNEGQVANMDTYVGRRTGNAANVTFLNYLSAIDKVGDVSRILPATELPTEVIDQSIAFTV